MMAEVLARIVAIGRTTSDRALLRRALGELDARHRLESKIAAEPNLASIMTEFVTRLSDAFGSLSATRGQAVLDIACGSSSSGSPVTGRQTAEFEPWMCRLLVELGAHPVGLDIGDLGGEAFEHHRVDLGVPRRPRLPGTRIVRCHPREPALRLTRVSRRARVRHRTHSSRDPPPGAPPLAAGWGSHPQ